MTVLRLLRPVLACLILAGLVGLAHRLSVGGTPSVDAGPLRLEFGLVNLILFTYIAALTWLLAGYSSTNLRGQHRLGRFGALFVGVTVSLLILVLAGNLLTLAVVWTMSGVLLASLVSHTGTVNADAAGRHVQRSMALSSGLLWVAVIVAAASGLRLDGTDTGSALGSTQATLIAVLIVVAGAVRSSLAPFHRWLPETAEAPSPVSALLHAGIVNAAGVIAVLQWDLLSAQPAVLLVLAVAGLVTVVWCSLEQRVRPDVKGRLAASTSAQMGWMALQVGLGAPAAALLHLMSHGAWKAWLFLRAGGAVVRARRESSRGPVVWSQAGAMSVLALAPAAALLIAAGVGGSDSPSASPIHLLLLGTAVVLGLAVGVEAAALEGTGLAVRSVVASSGGLAIATYLFVAVVFEQQVSVRTDLSHPALDWGALMAATAVIAVALLAWTAVRLHPGSDHPVATLVSSTSLPPRAGLPGLPARIRDPHPARGISATTITPQGPADRETDALVRKTVEMAGKLMGPAWPLRATVAVNPLAGLEVLPFDTALALGERFHAARLRPSFDWFLDLYDQGQISDAELERAMDDHGVGGGPRGADGLVDLTRDIVALDQPALTATHETSPKSARRRPSTEAGAAAGASRPLAHAHVWSARAWHRAEDRTADLHGPWRLWKHSARHPSYGATSGSRGARILADSLPEDPVRAIGVLLDRAGHGSEDLFDVVTSLLAAGPGWVAHAQWRARRSGTADPLVELVALRLALTVLHGVPVLAPPTSTRNDPAEGATNYLLLQKVWLDALDRSTQDLLCRPLAERQSQASTGTSSTRTSTTNLIASSLASAAVAPVSQSVWCIDVRSEPMRRHLESMGPHETFGFAGFFGITGRVNLPEGTSFDQCPVIVTPTIEIDVAHQRLDIIPAMSLAATRVAARPGLAFGVAEAAGALAFAAAVAANLAPRTWRRILDRSVRGHRNAGPIMLRDLADPSRDLDSRERAGAAEAMLRTIGLTSGFAPVLILAGHGSTTENNAYATAYDCGACGGNPGLLNAMAMAQVLNDPAVRAELDHRGIHLPDTTRVLAALHDTTTDRVTLQISSPADVEAAALVQPAVDAAGRVAAAERRLRLPTHGRRATPRRGSTGGSLEARATDWSEPMPEWGLAGCAAIIVGPRHLTRGIDLAGRTFLHSYNRHDDPDGTVLTAILNAPVIVSQWIASQYWFSSVAPTVLGSGDKTTHNVVGDIGVLTGAHGDLRTGLPWQALFARDPGTHPDSSSRPQHVPSRHLVVIDADPALLASAVRQSPGVMTLLTNNWMRLVALDRGHVVDIATILASETDPAHVSRTTTQPPRRWPTPDQGQESNRGEVGPR
ncbi:putative inorganic carbon transporter subunit DabA [Nocardioides okcheonensis]|uniref:putative inorganic carbon transporter subunit DabA n=1 Tax=Nocardioides okcheonensis TaxID=2894081 RepID=UPI001E369EC9|nr:putative inorganic carbon transporter subunit DabA [Nocardioides okcheonensis]UFN45128.1 Na-translocating system protein MpsB [Nocardioides okcheonensis]